MADPLEDVDAGDESTAWALRPVTLEDVEQIAFAELELFPDEAWNVFQLAEEIAHRDRRYVVAAQGERAEGALLGYAGIMLAGDLADLHTIGTRDEGRGIGRALLAWCETQAREGGAQRMLLEVREDNDRARAFYTAAGYREIDRRRGYYRIRGRRIDALVMQRDLGAGGGPSA
ncbi:GNAT family N-acetyltransferase [Brachybacterium avium]|uniref:GNAT family N-acetyltransferase n=1 Tax=Brachybacterium avium TaxID=2017485 RepID=A0A220UAH3_9MICO|nr:GNAT family N-acetyltransferase [Brachybacterium avium]ASK65117.1 GNAT family N-acetyltransferase [Brachybacterium avium]